MRPRFETFRDRREFLRSIAAIAAAGPAGMSTLLDAWQPAITLKTSAEYARFASAFDGALAAVQRISFSSITTTTDIDRLTQQVEAAGYAVDGYFDWLVTQCSNDAALVSWTKQNLQDKGAFDRWVAQVTRNPSSVDTIPGVSALRSRLTTLAAQKRGILEALIREQAKVAGLETSAADAAAAARAVAEEKEKDGCTKAFGIIAAIVLVVVALVLATTSFGAGQWESLSTAAVAAYVTHAANRIALAWTGVGAPAGGLMGAGIAAAGSAIAVANTTYQQCLAAARALPQAQRAKAIAACQVKWVGAKLPYIT